MDGLINDISGAFWTLLTCFIIAGFVLPFSFFAVIYFIWIYYGFGIMFITAAFCALILKYLVS